MTLAVSARARGVTLHPKPTHHRHTGAGAWRAAARDAEVDEDLGVERARARGNPTPQTHAPQAHRRGRVACRCP